MAMKVGGIQILGCIFLAVKMALKSTNKDVVDIKLGLPDRPMAGVYVQSGHET